MKAKLLFYLFLLFFSLTKEQKLTLTKYIGPKYKVKTGTWTDLLDVSVDCPNKGIFKNFILKKENGYFWYEYQCYSSVTENSDYGEPIIKVVRFSSYNKIKTTLQSYIQALNQYSLECDVDYGLNSFKLYISQGLIKRDTFCHGLKATYTSKTVIATTGNIAYYGSMDGLTNILVGRTDTENDVDIGFPLRGFQYVVDSSKSTYYPTIYYLYSYSKLRNMAVVADAYKKKFQELRNANTQKN